MPEQKSSNFNQAVWLSISYTCSMLVGILSSAILSRYFDKAEYGTYKQIIFVYQIMLTLFQVGLPSVFTYFLPRHSKEEGKFIVKKINRLLFALGGLFSVSLFLLSGVIAGILKNPELATGLKIFSIFPIFTLPTIGVEGIYTVNKNTRFVAVYQVITRLLMLICIIIPVLYIKNDYRYALVGWGIASFITFIIASYAKKNVYKDNESVSVPNITSEIFKYTLPIMGSAIIGMSFNSSNQFFISRYVGTEAFAEFTNGYLTLPFVAMFVTPVRTLLTPMFSKGNLDNDYKEALGFLYSGMKQISTIMVPLIVYSFFYAKDIMVLVYGNEYESSYIYFRLMCIFNFAEIFIFSGVLYAIGRTDVDMRMTLYCSVLLWITCFALVLFNNQNPLWFVLIFLVANILARYVMPGLYLVFKENIKVLNFEVIKYITKITLHTVLAAIITALFAYKFIAEMNSFWRLIISFVLFYFLIIISSKLVKVNYLQAISRFIVKKNKN